MSHMFFVPSNKRYISVAVFAACCARLRRSLERTRFKIGP